MGAEGDCRAFSDEVELSAGSTRKLAVLAWHCTVRPGRVAARRWASMEECLLRAATRFVPEYAARTEPLKGCFDCCLQSSKSEKRHKHKFLFLKFCIFHVCRRADQPLCCSD